MLLLIIKSNRFQVNIMPGISYLSITQSCKRFNENVTFHINFPSIEEFDLPFCSVNDGDTYNL